jgi:hypothetical protein
VEVTDLQLQRQGRLFVLPQRQQHDHLRGQRHPVPVPPGEAGPVGENRSFSRYALDNQHAIEYAAYIDNEQSFGPRLSLQYGIRFSAYNFIGAQTVYEYAGEGIDRKANVGSRTYDKGESIALYTNPEPRLSLRYTLDETSSIKASYNRMAQYVHLISNSTAASPFDVWSPTTKNIKPELADQVAVGYFRNFKDNMFETSVEVFYKEMQNQIDYIPGAQVLLNKELEADLLYGRGRAYGLELYAKKNTGRLTGWISYTLSRSERLFDGLNVDQASGQASGTRPSTTAATSARWWASTISTSGGAFRARSPTPRRSHYVPQRPLRDRRRGHYRAAQHRWSRNNFRVPAYHRLDLAATTLAGQEK